MIAKIISVFVFSHDTCLATFRIRKAAEIKNTSTALYWLKKMEKLCIVDRSPHSTSNNIVWKMKEPANDHR